MIYEISGPHGHSLQVQVQKLESYNATIWVEEYKLFSLILISLSVWTGVHIFIWVSVTNFNGELMPDDTSWRHQIETFPRYWPFVP